MSGVAESLAERARSQDMGKGKTFCSMKCLSSSSSSNSPNFDLRQITGRVQCSTNNKLIRGRSCACGIVVSLKTLTCRYSFDVKTVVKLRFAYDDHRQRRSPGVYYTRRSSSWGGLPCRRCSPVGSLFSVVTLWYRSPLLIS